MLIMQPHLKRRRFRTVLTSWPVLAVLLLFSGWMSVKAFDMYQRYTDNVKRLNEVMEKQDALGVRILYLNETTDRLATPEGIEEEIQARLPYAREGEQVIFIVNDASTTDSTEVIEEDGRWWQIWRLWK